MATSYHGQLRSLKLNSIPYDGTIEFLERLDPPYMCAITDDTGDAIQEYRAVVAQNSELIHSGDYVKLNPPFCQFTYGLLLTTVKQKEHTVCIVQGFDPMELPTGEQLLNDFDCPLFNLSRTLFSVDSTTIVTATSMVHECGNSCHFQETQDHSMVERELVESTTLVFKHDWTQLLYCYNVYCILKE